VFINLDTFKPLKFITLVHRYASVGASGSGKTTLLKLLAGNMEPSSGSVDTRHCKPMLFDDEAFKQLGNDLGAAGSLRKALAVLDFDHCVSGQSVFFNEGGIDYSADGSECSDTLSTDSSRHDSLERSCVRKPITCDALLTLVPDSDHDMPWTRMALPRRVGVSVVLALAKCVSSEHFTDRGGTLSTNTSLPILADPSIPSSLTAKLSLTLQPPPLLLFDEVFDGLPGPSAWATPACKHAVSTVLQSAATSFGCSVVLATHDLQHTATLADRVLVFSAGKLKDDASPQSSAYFLAFKKSVQQRR